MTILWKVILAQVSSSQSLRSCFCVQLKEELQCCAGEMLPMDNWAWVGLMKRLWLSHENVNSFTGSK